MTYFDNITMPSDGTITIGNAVMNAVGTTFNLSSGSTIGNVNLGLVSILGALESADNLPTTGQSVGNAYFVKGKLYVYTQTGWTNLGQIGINGPPGQRGPQGLQGGLYNRKAITDNYTVEYTDNFIFCNQTKPITITLPVTTDVSIQMYVIITDATGNAQTNTITIVADNNTISGRTNLVIDQSYSSRTITNSNITYYLVAAL